MPVFKSLKEVERAILERSSLAVKAAEEKVFNSLHKYLSFYYAEYTPVDYERTWQLFNSLVKSGIKVSRTGTKGVSSEVYFDSSALNYKDIKEGDKWSTYEVLQTALVEGRHGGEKLNIGGTAVWESGRKEMGDVYALLRRALIDAGIPIR